MEDETGKSDTPPNLRREWSRKVAAVTIDDEMQAGIRDWACDYFERVNVIVSTGKQLDSYDSLYVATVLESLQSVRRLLQQRDLAHLVDFDTVDPDALHYIRR